MRLAKLAIAFSFLLCSCSNTTRLKKPEDTNLDFWITQVVTHQEMQDKGCTVIPGWFGATEYLSSGYEPLIVEEHSNRIPEIHVTYLVQSYPDAMSNSSSITRINITDPTVTVFGLTINSSQEEITNRMKKVSGASGKDRVYKIKDVTFGFNEDNITISVPVTNKQHIVY